jgi:hypothetical protein
VKYLLDANAVIGLLAGHPGLLAGVHKQSP